MADKKELDVLDMRRYIKKSHLKAVEKFNEDLEAFRKETGEEAARLYEGPFVSFTLKDVHVDSMGELHVEYDGCGESHVCVKYDREEHEYYEVEYEGIMDYIKFWRSCLRRAKRFWAMDTDTLDAIQNGEAEFHDEEED